MHPPIHQIEINSSANISCHTVSNCIHVKVEYASNIMPYCIKFLVCYLDIQEVCADGGHVFCCQRVEQLFPHLRSAHASPYDLQSCTSHTCKLYTFLYTDEMNLFLVKITHVQIFRFCYENFIVSHSVCVTFINTTNCLWLAIKCGRSSW